MKKAAFILMVVSLLASFNAAANKIQLRGTPSCSQWQADKDIPERALVDIDQFWLLGYLSGKVTTSGKDFLRGTENETIYQWVDGFCKRNPQKYLDEAGDALSADLIKQKSL